MNIFRLAEKLAGVGLDLFDHVLDQAAPAQQMPAKLFDELLEACAALSARRLLMRLRHRGADGEEVAHVERQRLDQDILIPLQLIELARQAIQPFGDGGFALVAGVG